MKKTLNSFERQLCDIQGRLFERSFDKGLDSVDFINKFMDSKTCEYLDMPYDRLQWAGEEYILENLLEETAVQPAGEQFSKEEMFWTGYVYRYWHLLMDESSRRILFQADAELMRDSYLGFHALDINMVIEDLKEIYRQKPDSEKYSKIAGYDVTKFKEMPHEMLVEDIDS